MTAATTVSYIAGNLPWTADSTNAAKPSCDTPLSRTTFVALYKWTVNAYYSGQADKALAAKNFETLALTVPVAPWAALQYNVANTFGPTTIPMPLQPHMTNQQ